MCFVLNWCLKWSQLSSLYSFSLQWNFETPFIKSRVYFSTPWIEANLDLFYPTEVTELILCNSKPRLLETLHVSPLLLWNSPTTLRIKSSLLEGKRPYEGESNCPSQGHMKPANSLSISQHMRGHSLDQQSCRIDLKLPIDTLVNSAKTRTAQPTCGLMGNEKYLLF